MTSGKDSDGEEELFDAYLDALLRGEELEPEAYAEAHGARDGALPGWLKDVWGMVHGTVDAGTEVDESLPVARVGDFDLVRCIGEGGMGRVFLAKQAPMGRLCAVKLLRAALAGSPTASLRMEREAQVVGELTHDNIVRVLGAGDEGGVPWIAFELVPGMNLDEVVHEELPAVSQVVSWGAELAGALSYAHGAGIVHRDLKPSNVRIHPSRRAMLLDFGLALRMDRESLVLTHEFTGTPSYVAPEQVNGGEVDGRCDVYGLGATLYEALCGRPPHSGETMEAVLHSVLHGDPAPLFERRGRIPRDLAIVVHKALEKDPDRRYSDAQAMRDDLVAIQELRAIKARPLGIGARGMKWVQRHKALAAVVMTAVVGALAWSAFEANRAQNVRRADLDEATELVAEARSRLQSYEDGRELYERANYAVQGARLSMAERYMSRGEIQALRESRRIVNEYEALKVSLEAIPVRLGRAEKLDPNCDGIPDAWASYWFQLWMDVRDENNRDLRNHYAERIHAVDPGGPWSLQVAGQVALQIRSDPPGAQVYFYRYMPVVEPAGERRVLEPIGGAATDWDPGSWALRVLNAKGPFLSGDLILEVAGHPVRGSVLAMVEGGARERMCRILSVDGTSVSDPFEAEAALGDPSATHASVEFFGRSEGRTIESVAVQALSHVLSPEGVVATGGVDVAIWREGAFLSVELVSGVETRTTAVPIPMSREAQVGFTPLQFPTSDPGDYLALVTLEGFESQRLSFHIDHACEHYAKGLTLTANLLPSGTTPAGFVHVALDSLGTGGKPFWIQEREVTCGEFLEFIRGETERGQWKGAAPMMPDGFEDDWPMLGVTAEQANQYAEWYSLRPEIEGAKLAASLPTRAEWMWAANGGDSRKYVHGYKFSSPWVKGRFSRAQPTPEPVRSFPVDESPWGIYDLAGSASEWVWQKAGPRGQASWALCGGSWNLNAARDFAVQRVLYSKEGRSDPGAGFRLVLRAMIR